MTRLAFSWKDGSVMRDRAIATLTLVVTAGCAANGEQRSMSLSPAAIATLKP